MDARIQGRAFLVLAFILAAVTVVMVKKGDPRRGIAFLAGWALPGAGHAVLGRWKKGLFFFLLLSATLFFGLHLVNYRPVSFDDNPFYYVGQFGSGLTVAAAKFLSTEKAVPRSDLHPSWFDPGLLYVCVAGLLNLVVMMNVLDLKAATVPASAPPAAEPASAAAPAPAPAPETPA